MPALPDKKKTSYQIELERRANDLLRVFNPLGEDQIVIWDKRSGGKVFRVPAKQEAVLVRYIAEKYVKEMYQKILNDRAMKAIMKENDERVKKGLAEMDKTFKTNEQMVFEQKFYRPSNEEARKIISLLYVGVETEYGIDRAYRADQEEVESREFGDVLKTVQDEKGTTPTNGEKTPEIVPSEATEDFTCDFPNCGFAAKSKLGLFSHKRTHQKEVDIEE